jgi:hypothetical protein
VPERAAMPAGLHALGYVALRRWVRRTRGDAGRPWAVLGVVAAVALVAGLQVLALDGAGAGATPGPGLTDPLLRLAPLLLPALLLASTFSTPLRLQIAEASWVLTAPGGARALLARALLIRPLGFAAVGLAGTTIARWSLGRPLDGVWKVALAGALVGLALRLVSFGGHVAVVRARGAVALRVVAVAWAGALVTAAAIDLPGGDWLALRAALEPLLDGVFDPAPLSAPGLLAGLAALVTAAATLLASARGVEEPAYAAARRLAETQEAMRTWRSGGQLTMARFRDGATSLRGWDALAGERALSFRALSQQRRLMLPSVVAFGFFLDLAVPAVLLATAPAFTWAWALLGLAGAGITSASMLAVEREHHHLRLAPLRPLPALLWLAAVPATHRVVSIELSWLPVLLMPGMTAGGWLAGALLIGCLVALMEASGALAVVAADRVVVRALLKPAIFVLGVLPAAVALIAALALGATTGVAALPAAAVMLAAARSCFALAAPQIWPTTRTHSHVPNHG